MMSRIVSRRTSTFTVSGVEGFRVNDEFEAFKVLEHDGKFVSAALFTLAFAL